MQVSQKGKIVHIQPTAKLPVWRIARDAGLLLVLIWGLFAFFSLFQSQPTAALAPYFIALSAFILIALLFGLLLRHSRHYRPIVFDAHQRSLSAKGLGRQKMIPFDDITALRLHEYRYKRGQSLYRLEAVRVSQKTFAIIRDVPHPEPLYSLGKKMGKMSRIPFEAPGLEE